MWVLIESKKSKHNVFVCRKKFRFVPIGAISNISQAKERKTAASTFDYESVGGLRHKEICDEKEESCMFEKGYKCRKGENKGCSKVEFKNDRMNVRQNLCYDNVKL